jgi:hypothetical protein
VGGEVADVVLTSVEKDDFDHEIWIGDSGASCHHYNNDDGFNDDTEIFEEITAGNGNLMIAEEKGKLRCEILQKN